jgi:hypothetical protein
MVLEDADRGILRYTWRKIAVWCHRMQKEAFSDTLGGCNGVGGCR